MMVDYPTPTAILAANPAAILISHTSFRTTTPMRITTRGTRKSRVDQREPSGARPGCVNSYGVHDMTGNVDEWVLNEQGLVNESPRRSGLKGGHWGPVRNRCRPMTGITTNGTSDTRLGSAAELKRYPK